MTDRYMTQVTYQRYYDLKMLEKNIFPSMKEASMKELVSTISRGSTGDKIKNRGQNLRCNPTVSARDVERACVYTNCLHNPIYKEEEREFDNLSSRSHVDREYRSVPYCYHFSYKPIFDEIVTESRRLTAKNLQQ